MLPDALVKYNITFEEAKKDSPQFRENIALFSRDLEETIAWVHSLKAQKDAIVHAINRHSLALKNLSDQFGKKLGVISFTGLIRLWNYKFHCGSHPNNSIGPEKTGNDWLTKLDLSLQKPLDNSLLENLEQVKSLKKAYEKQRSKYDRALLSWTVMAKNTDNVSEVIL